MNVPNGLRYSIDHQWVRLDSNGRVRAGVTEYAQDALGEIVFVDLPSLGVSVETGEAIGEVESTKSVSELFAPV